jgi:P-type Mg2+ transporter
VDRNVESDASAWWRMPSASAPAEFGASPSGLSSAEARARLARYGRNELLERPAHSALVQFLRRFRNPLVLILIVASVISALTGELASFIIIVVMVLLSVILDFLQEYRAGQAALKLRQTVEIQARVSRDGATMDVPTKQVVPGDVVSLAAGSLVPADGRLLEVRDLFVNQALLTGESFPVQKRPEQPADRQAEPSGATDALFMGTSVVSGTARLVVCRTGRATALGEIAHTLSLDPPPTAFEVGTRRFGMLIMRLTCSWCWSSSWSTR